MTTRYLVDAHVHLNNYHEATRRPTVEHVHDLFDKMAECGVDHAVVITSYKVDLDRPSVEELLSVLHNDPRTTMVEGLRLRGETRTDLFHMEERIRDGRMKGIKLYPGYDKYAINDPSLEHVFHIAAKYDVPILIHTGDTYSKDAKVRQSHPLLVDDIAVDFRLLIDSGSGPTLSWLRDAPWTHAQTYSKETSAVPVTTFTRDDLSLTVTLTDIVSPNADVLTRHLHVTRGSGSPVTSVALVLYENLSPCLSKLEQLPFVDWALDSHNDFLALYDDQTGQIIHFHPGDRHKVKGLFDIKADPAATDYGAVEALMKEDPPVDSEVSSLVQNLDGSYASGVAAVVTTSPAPTEFQVGGDATPLCSQVDVLADNIEKLPALFPGVPPPLDPQIVSALRCTDPLPLIVSGRGWTWTPEDALADAADGSLSGSRVAAGQTNGALIAPLSFSGDETDGSVVIALGATQADARSALGEVSKQTVTERKDAAEAATDAALKNAHLPDPALGDLVHVTALRALVNVYVARDAESGAIVASVSRQPPYHLDWPRDGAFFSAGLDAAGIHDWVTQRYGCHVSIRAGFVHSGRSRAATAEGEQHQPDGPRRLRLRHPAPTGGRRSLAVPGGPGVGHGPAFSPGKVDPSRVVEGAPRRRGGGFHGC